MRALIMLVLAGLLLTACGTSTPGTPVAAGTTAAPAPVRPRTIDLKGKDPCVVPGSFTSRFDAFGAPTRQLDLGYHEPECVYNDDWGAAFIMFDTKEGIDVWLAGKYEGNAVRSAPILGFPAVDITFDTDPGRCDVIVDVAPHESLSGSTERDELNVPPVKPCTFSREWAQATMSALVSQH